MAAGDEQNTKPALCSAQGTTLIGLNKQTCGSRSPDPNGLDYPPGCSTTSSAVFEETGDEPVGLTRPPKACSRASREQRHQNQTRGPFTQTARIHPPNYIIPPAHLTFFPAVSPPPYDCFSPGFFQFFGRRETKVCPEVISVTSHLTSHFWTKTTIFPGFFRFGTSHLTSSKKNICRVFRGFWGCDGDSPANRPASWWGGGLHPG